MVNADALPALFASCSRNDDGSLQIGGARRLLASIENVWVTTTDPDGVHVSAEDFSTIAAAISDEGALLIDASPEPLIQHVAARPINGVRWLLLTDPQPE